MKNNLITNNSVKLKISKIKQTIVKQLQNQEDFNGMTMC